jgi:hypothetical protein
MTIAVVVFMWQASESRREAGTGRTANSRPAPMKEIPVERIELLARFEPPAYEATAKGSRALRTAMKLYSERDYSGAIPALRAAAVAEPESVEPHFYLGICLMLANDLPGSVKELRSLIATGDTPYLERARFYLAKGLLGEHDIPGAEQQLRKVVEMHGGLEKEAGVLLAQVVPTP